MHGHKGKNIYCGIVKFGGACMLGISIMGFLTFLQTAVFVVGYISNNNCDNFNNGDDNWN